MAQGEELSNAEISRVIKFLREMSGYLLRQNEEKSGRIAALEKEVKELRRCQHGERASPLAVSENYIPLEESKESSVVLGTPGTPLRDDSLSSPCVKKHNDQLYDPSSDASPKQSVASNASPAQTTDRQSQSRSPAGGNEQAMLVHDKEMDAFDRSRKDQLRYLFNETSDSEQPDEGSETGDKPTREERMTELLEVVKEVVSESLKGKKLIHGPDEPRKQYPFLMQGAINEKAFIATGAHTVKTLAKYLFTVKVTHKLFLEVEKYAGEEDKLDIRCWLELALFYNLCPQAENSSYYIDRALDRLVPAVAALHDGIYEETYTKEKMHKDLSNEVTLYDKEEVIQKARELFGLLEGGDEQHDDEPSDGARSDGVEEEKEEEEAAAAKAANFSLTFRNLPGQPQVTDASGQACISRASMQQQGFEEAPPPVRGGDRASGSSGARPFDSPELAKRVQDHFRKEFPNSDVSKAPSAHGTRREDYLERYSMGRYAKGGQTPSSCNTGNNGSNGSDTSSSDTSGGEDDQSVTTKGGWRYAEAVDLGLPERPPPKRRRKSKAVSLSGLDYPKDQAKINEEWEAEKTMKKKAKRRKKASADGEVEVEEDEVMQQGRV